MPIILLDEDSELLLSGSLTANQGSVKDVD